MTYENVSWSTNLLSYPRLNSIEIVYQLVLVKNLVFIWQETIGELHRRACEIFDLNLEQVMFL